MMEPTDHSARKPPSADPLSDVVGGEALDLGDVEGPLFWPEVLAEGAAGEWASLRHWVQGLIRRFDLDYHAVPRCWYRHNNIVEALVALRDHERASYDETAAPTAAVDFHKAFRDLEARLREWTGRLACGARHEPPADRPDVDNLDWTAWLAADVERRRMGPVVWALDTEDPTSHKQEGQGGSS